MTTSPLKHLLSLIATLLPLLGAVTSRADFVVADSNFAATDWLATIYFSSGAPPSHIELASGSGGNPGAFRRMTHGLLTSSSVGIFHEFLPASYDPSISGPLDSLTYREDRVEFSPPFPGAAIGANPALIQGGVHYFGPNITFTNTLWQTSESRGLTATSFTSAAATHPDFGSTGGPLRFGFARSNTSTASSGLGTTHGIDNWSYTLHTAASVGAPESDPPTRRGMRILGPNPGSGRIAVQLSCVAANRSTVTVHDLSGRRIRTLADREFPAGTSELAWDARDERGGRVISGVYFVVVRSDGEMDAARVVVAH